MKPRDQDSKWERVLNKWAWQWLFKRCHWKSQLKEAWGNGTPSERGNFMTFKCGAKALHFPAASTPRCHSIWASRQLAKWLRAQRGTRKGNILTWKSDFCGAGIRGHLFLVLESRRSVPNGCCKLYPWSSLLLGLDCWKTQSQVHGFTASNCRLVRQALLYLLYSWLHFMSLIWIIFSLSQSSNLYCFILFFVNCYQTLKFLLRTKDGWMDGWIIKASLSRQGSHKPCNSI